MNKTISLSSAWAFALITTLTGCDSGGTSARTTSAGPVKLTVSVLNDEGPVTAAKIEAKDSGGSVIARGELKNGAKADLSIPAGTRFPLIVFAYPDESPNQPLKAAVTDNQATEQDVSPVTTIVVDTALSLGGITETNLAKAAGAAIAQRKRSGGGGGGGGATTESFKGDPTKQYGGWH